MARNKIVTKQHNEVLLSCRYALLFFFSCKETCLIQTDLKKCHIIMISIGFSVKMKILVQK